MSKTKPQHARLLFIDRKIREGKYPSCMQLALEGEVSYRAMQRDIDYMRYQLDAPIEYSAKERGLFYSEDNFNLPAFSIKESDLFAIYLAENLLVQYEGTPLYDNLQSVYEKIAQSLPDTISIDAETIHSRVTVFPSACAVIDPFVWETVFQCLRTLKRLLRSRKFIKNHLAELVLAHPKVQIQWLGSLFLPCYFPSGKQILITDWF